MKMFTIPFTETTIHFGRAWSTLSSTTKGTERDDLVPDARVGAIAMRLVKKDAVISAAAVSVGNALPVHAPVITDEVIEQAAEAVEAVAEEPPTVEEVETPAEAEPSKEPDAPVVAPSGDPDDDWDALFAYELENPVSE